MLATTEHDPATVAAEIDLAEVKQCREGIPVRVQRRNDMYQLKSLK